jgi:hypothetical protein
MSPRLPLAPPFVASPLGQRIAGRGPRTDANDPLRSTPTPNSPAGGLTGFTRSQGQQPHRGFDDPSRFPRSDISGRRTDITRWTGSGQGTVTKVGPAYEIKRDGSRGLYVGQSVTIVMRDARGHVWESTTMHHQEILVRPGDRVSPLQPIARGSGIGDQFAQPTAGGPHVHWQVKVDGQRVDPITGRPWDEIFPRSRR